MRKGLLPLFLLFAAHAFATHIVGGEMYYTYLGNDNYQVTLKLYRDCGPGNTNNTALDAQAAIGIFNSSGGLVNTVHFDLPGEITVPVITSSPCLTAPPSVCAKEGIYTGVIHLPSGTGGYTLSYQRCCRSATVINLNNSPSSQGMTCTVHVPDAAVTGPNSSPVFSDDPPVAMCLDQTMTIDQLATDPDGDSLAYALCAPLQGGDNVVNVIPDPPAPPPYVPVVWAPGYSTGNQLNSVPPMQFSSTGGMLTLHPTTIGSYAVSICVSEYRNGTLLSSVIRDFRFMVVNCVQSITSSFQGQESQCDGLAVQMHNQSSGDFYHWDFGVPGALTDTSDESDPAYIYTQPGTYTISLIANPGWPCADTSSGIWTVHDPVQVAFQPPHALCQGQLPVTLTATGNFSPAATIHWDLGDGFSANADTAVTTVDIPSLGSHPITVSVDDGGCTNSYTDSIHIFPMPVVSFTADTNGCTPFEPQFTNTSTAGTPMSYLWSLGDGSTSVDSIPDHLYTASGVYSVTLTVSTDSGCVASESLTKQNLISVWPTPHAQATALPSSTSVLFPDVTITDHTPDAVAWDFVVEGEHDTVPEFIHTFSDAGWYTVFLTATTGFGCYDTTSIRVFIGDHLFYAPTAFSPNGDGYNEIWKPSMIGAREYHLDIFNRWGLDVFHTTDPDQGWDGKGAEPGIYAYKAWLTEYGPLEQEYNGSFVLIR